MRALRILLLLVFATFFPVITGAQEEAEKSAVLQYVEETLSAPNRQISLNGLEGTLSSSVSLTSITIADQEGVWLTIIEPKLEWSRRALLLGRLEIESLTAKRIDMPRGPLPDESLPDAEAAPFAVPDLPVSVVLEKLAIDEIAFGQPVFGLESRAQLGGSIRLADGTLDVDLAVNRLDKPGQFTAKATYGGGTPTLDLDVVLEEPEGGILANLLNLQGEPPVRLAVLGNGPLDDLTTTLAFDVSGERIIDGSLVVGKVDGGTRVVSQLNGPLSKILPQSQRSFFGDSSRVEADVLMRDGGGVTVERAVIDSGDVQLTANARTTADSFLELLKVELRLASATGERVTIPGTAAEAENRPGDAGAGEASLQMARLSVDYDATAGERWSSALEAQDFRSSGITLGDVRLTADGTVTNLNDAANRALTYRIDGELGGISAEAEAVAQALGDTITIGGDGTWSSGQAVQLNGFAVRGQSFALTADGAFESDRYDGRIGVEAQDLSAFARLAQRDLAGATNLALDGTIFPVSGMFDLRFEGTANDATVGIPQADALLAGQTVLSGGAERGETGLIFRNLTVQNQQVSANVDGRYASDQSDVTANVKLADVGLLTPRASGAVDAKVTLVGAQKPFDLDLILEMPDGIVSDRPVENLALSFDGTTDLASVDGLLSANGRLSSRAIRLDGAIAVSEALQAVRDLDAEIGETILRGSATRFADGLLEADIAINSSDVSDVAALALVEASGSVNGTVKLERTGNLQSGAADVTIADLTYGTVRVGRAALEATFADLFGKPKVNATVDGNAIAAGGVVIDTLDGTVANDGPRTSFDISAALNRNDARIAASGEAVQEDSETTIELTTFTLDSNIADARLEQPATVRLANGTTTVSDARLAVGSGFVTVDGTAGSTLDLAATIRDLPLDIANAIVPDLGARGTITGDIKVAGTSAAPDITFDVTGDGLSVRQIADADVAPLDVVAKGQFADNTVRLETASVTNAQGVSISASGTVPLSGPGLAIAADVQRLPLALANAVRPELEAQGDISGTARVAGSIAEPTVQFDVQGTGILAQPLADNGLAPLALSVDGNFARNTVQIASLDVSNGQGISVSASGTVPLSGSGLAVDARVANIPASLANAARPELQAQGTITGTASVRGSIASPDASFSIDGSGLSARPLVQAGVSPLALSVTGSFANNVVQLSSASVNNGQGVSINASGSVPLSGGGLSVSVAGQAPLSLADSFLITRGTRVTGTARVDATVTGSIAEPQINGLASVSDGSVFDPLSNLRLNNIGLLAGLNGDQLSIQRFNANLSTGGSISASGTVGLSASLPADITVTMTNANYTDGQTFATTASGRLTLTGPLASAPLLAGQVELERTEVLIPESFGGSGDLLQVTHVAPPPPVARTLERLERASPTPTPTSRPVILSLDVTVNAPARIFVRGRGLDAELGGSITVRGPVNDVRPVGQFELIRGRLDLLGQRIVLDEGTIQLTGGLDPLLRFVAKTEAGEVTAFVTIEGRASDLEVTFSSTPSLPDDEVLARVVFGRSIGELSPSQIARLVTIAAELTGGNSPGLIDGLRAGTGLDDLDVVTDADGNAAVQAGKYISDNVYLGVEAGSTSRATINLDITDNLTVRGAAGTEGDSEIGIFFEKDY